MGWPALRRLTNRAHAERPYRRSMAAQRPRGPRKPGSRGSAERPDDWPITEAVSGANAGKAGPPLSAISAAVEVPRCEGNALRTSASNESEYESAARGRDRKVRSLGCARGGCEA